VECVESGFWAEGDKVPEGCGVFEVGGWVPFAGPVKILIERRVSKRR
jgi:hypothetical protein